jgi:hypothetical protein
MLIGFKVITSEDLVENNFNCFTSMLEIAQLCLSRELGKKLL